MNNISRRAMLAGTAGLIAAPRLARAQAVKPRLTVIAIASIATRGE